MLGVVLSISVLSFLCFVCRGVRFIKGAWRLFCCLISAKALTLLLLARFCEYLFAH